MFFDSFVTKHMLCKHIKRIEALEEEVKRLKEETPQHILVDKYPDSNSIPFYHRYEKVPLADVVELILKKIRYNITIKPATKSEICLERKNNVKR